MYKIEQGDNLIGIASAHDLGNWRTIYDDPENGELRKSCPDPMVLLPGLEITIPKKKTALFTVMTDKKHTFQVKKPKCFFAVTLLDETGAPYANTEYELSIDGEDLGKHTTDASGKIGGTSHPIEPDAKEAILKFDRNPGDPFTWTIKLGHLDPVTEDRGVQARLNNLGFGAGAIDGDVGEKTKAAVRSFQEAEGLKATGKVCKTTRQKLADRQKA